uniref:RNA-directed DNA polymerase n=1 Tax=Lygus hesperus TaxID=30085 RepID=A0A0A9VXD7_LYGHE
METVLTPAAVSMSNVLSRALITLYGPSLIWSFGLQGAPATFQRLALSLIWHLGYPRALRFLDVLILFHEDLHSHIQDLCQLLKILREVGLTLHIAKCHFAQPEVSYLGHTVNAWGVQPDPKKIEALSEFPTLKNPTDVKSFLGLCTYYCRVVPNFSKTAKPLSDITRKDIPFCGTEDCEAASVNLNAQLIQTPILAYHDFSKPFILATDGSKEWLGCVISQKIDGVDHPVAYASRHTTSPEASSHCATELELAALVCGVKQFHHYICRERILWYILITNP